MDAAEETDRLAGEMARKAHEADALAILRIGGSFRDAAEFSGLTTTQVIALWALRNSG